MRVSSAASNFRGRAPGTCFLVLVCFFLSGAAGLVYEVVWARQLSLFLGITSFAHTAVITAYMAGLAAGSLYFGRAADRRAEPLRIYAWLEIGIAVYAALTPWMFDLLQLGYAEFAGVAGISGMSGHLTRFAIALLALLVPTFLMGGTLPLLVRGFVKSLPELGGAASRLYGVNTLGAMTGTLAAGYLLLPKAGIVWTIYTAVAINLGIAIVILSYLSLAKIPARSRREKAAAEGVGNTGAATAPLPKPLGPGIRFSVLAGFGLAGFASLLTQLAWIRALILVIGGSVYAFTITLASFLAGIGLGSLMYSRVFRHSSRSASSARMAQAALLACLIAFAILLGLPVIQALPEWFLRGFEVTFNISFAVFQLFVFLLCFMIMFLPTLFMGALFPLITVIWTSSAAAAGRGVGSAYAINTVGTIFGTLFGGLLILPWLGVHTVIQLAAGLYLFAALIFWLASSPGMGRPVRVIAPLLAIALFALTAAQIPPWDRLLMASGVYYRTHLTTEPLRNWSLQELISDYELLFYAEGMDGTVTVKSAEGERHLAVNGKTDASSKGDLPTQVLLGQLPLRSDREIRSAMVIGLGSGITAGTLATDPSVGKMTILEISSEVVEASSYFEIENYSVLADPRVSLVTADARNFLLATDERFDLIVSEPSNPWISGISNLFTSEFFQLARSRLNPGGIMSQWFHIYSMSEADFQSVLRAFTDQFEYVTVWQTLPGDLVLMGSGQPHALALETVDWAGDRDPAAMELRRAGIFSDGDLVRRYVFGGAPLRQYIAGAGVNSDKRPMVEFNAPRNLYAATASSNLAAIFKFLDGQNLAVPMAGMFNLQGDGISAPALNMHISTPGSVDANDVQARWLVSWQPAGEESVLGFQMATARILTWKFDTAEFYVQVSGHGSDVPPQELASLLSALLPAGGAEWGGLELPGGATGIWTPAVDEASQRVQIAAAWTCPDAAGGINRYAFVVGLPDPGRTAWQTAIDRETARISCL